MRKLLTLVLISITAVSYGQTFKYYYSNNPKFVNGTDTLLYPFTGGVNAPQVSAPDLNGDNHKDMFIFDRASNRVLCFIQTANGYVHAPQYEFKFPYMEGWALMRDFDLDGKEDLWTIPVNDRRYCSDTSNPYGELGVDINRIRILVQTTPAFGFRQIGQMVTDTGWSYKGFQGNVDSSFNRRPTPISVNHIDIPSLEDMDGDGDIDILAFYGFDQSPSYYENYKINPHNRVYAKDSTRFIFRDKCWGGIFYRGTLNCNFQIHMGRDDISNCYRLYEKKQQKDAGTTNLMLDVDRDGIKDLIYGDVACTNLLSLINGKDVHPQNRDSIISQNLFFPTNTVPFDHIKFPASYYADADTDGLSDLLVSTNNISGVKNTKNIWVYKNSGTESSPVFTFKGNSFFLFQHTLDFGSRTVPVLIDMDGDHKSDLIVATSGDYEATGNAKDQLYYYKNKGTNAYPVFELVDSNFLNISKDYVYEVHPTFGDLTGDGKSDMVVGETNGKLFYYKNTGTSIDPAYSLQTKQLGGINVGSNSTPQLVDLNRDGLLDLIVGNKGGVIKYFKNTGTPTIPQFGASATIDTLGGIVTREFYKGLYGYDMREHDGYATPQICELDGDTTTMEMVTGMWNGNVYIYTNVSDTPGKIFQKNDSLFALTAQTEMYSLLFGKRSVPFAANLDADNRLDLLIGNIGGGLNFYASIPSPIDTSISPGMGENPDARIKVYPNPAKDELNFDTYAMRESMTYEVVDVVGKVLLTGDVNHFYATHSINTQLLPEGMYFLKLKGNTQTFVSRFLISR